MKTLIRWLVIHVILFALVGVGAHLWLKQSPERILVAIDTSFHMTVDWPAVVELVDSLDANPGPYTEYALVTDKGPVHGWQKTLDLKSALQFGPRKLEAFAKDGSHKAIIDEATDHILVTNEQGAKVSGWSVRRPQ